MKRRALGSGRSNADRVGQSRFGVGVLDQRRRRCRLGSFCLPEGSGVGFDPVDVVRDAGIYAWVSGYRAAVTPADDANQRPLTTRPDPEKRPARVALAGVLAPPPGADLMKGERERNENVKLRQCVAGQRRSLPSSLGCMRYRSCHRTCRSVPPPPAARWSLIRRTWSCPSQPRQQRRLLRAQRHRLGAKCCHRAGRESR